MDSNQKVSDIRDKVKKLQEYYYHNTDEETADIIYKTLDDVIDIIDGKTLQIHNFE